LKVLFDTDLLIDIVLQPRQPSSQSMKLVNELLARDDVSLWLSASSLYNLHLKLKELKHLDKVDKQCAFIEQNFTIIPLRSSIFNQALKNFSKDFEQAVQIASATEFGIDYIITQNLDSYSDIVIPIITPDNFLKKLNHIDYTTTTSVPFMDLKAQHHLIYNEIDDRLTDIIANTGFILGKYVEEFEETFAELQGAKYCIGVSSGTDALHIALLALGIGPGDQVVVPVNTFIATAEAVSITGAKPLFSDCDQYYNIDIDKLRSELSALSKEQLNTVKAVIPVHLFGQPVNMDKLLLLAKEFELMIIEDSCQAHLAEWQGTKVGTFGFFGAFSFYPGKNLGAYGEAGALITNDKKLYDKSKMIRQHGELKRYHHQVIGHNYRMAAIQGAVLAVKCKYLAQWTESRRTNAKLYAELLKNIPGVSIPAETENSTSVYHLYVIEVDERDELQSHLKDKGIATGIHYPIPIHLQNSFKNLGYQKGDFPIAEKAANRILSLPMFPELTRQQIEYVCATIRAFQESREKDK